MIVNLFPMNQFDAMSIWDKTLANNTPEQIQYAAANGFADKLWTVGDKTAEISIGAVGNMPATSACAFIIGFDHNSYIEGTGIHFQFGKTTSGTDIAFVDSGFGLTHTSGTWFSMNNESSSIGGWESSRMRTVICPLFLSALPLDWQNIISETTKYTDNTGTSYGFDYHVTSTSDKIFLLAEYEVNGSRTYANTTEQNYQKQYDYYKNGSSKVKYKHNSTSNVCTWHLRSISIYESDETDFCRIESNGQASYNLANASSGFAPAFRVA